MARKPWMKILLALYVAAMLGISIPRVQKMQERSDHFVVWSAGKNFFQHKDLYSEANIRPYSYTPFAAFLFQPLHAFPYRTTALILFLLSALVLLPLTVLLLYKILVNMGVSTWRSRIVLTFALLMSIKYILNNLIMFQVNQVLFFLIVAGIYFLTKKKPHLAGLLFSVITMIKIIPVFLAAYVFFYHFSRKVATTMVITVLICLILPASMRGPARLVQDYHSYYEEFLKEYVVEGKIVAGPVNHSLKAGFIKSIHPESRKIRTVFPNDYPQTVRILTILQLVFLAILVINGIVMYRRKETLSLSYLASILLFAHLYSGLTWTAHLVTLTFCLLPFLLLEVRLLRPFAKVVYVVAIILMVFLGIEGRDLVGKEIYLFIRYYDFFTYMLVCQFLFCSWLVWSKRGKQLFAAGIQV